MAVLLEQKGNRNSKSPRDTLHAVTSWCHGVGELTRCELRWVAQRGGHWVLWLQFLPDTIPGKTKLFL